MTDATDQKVAAAHELDNRIFFRLFQTANLMHREGTNAIADLGVTTQQWSVLGALSRPQAGDGMSIGELSTYLMVSRQNVNGILNRLEKAGHIERANGIEDRRTRRVCLSGNGRELWEKLTRFIYRFYDDALRGLSFDERVAFLHYLNTLRDNMANM